MKAWRKKTNQDRFRHELFVEALREAEVKTAGDYPAYVRLYNEALDQYCKGRVGKALRDKYTRILPAPSFLMTGLLHRAGVYGEPAVAHDEVVLPPATLAALSAAPTNSVVGKLRKLLGL